MSSSNANSTTNNPEATKPSCTASFLSSLSFVAYKIAEKNQNNQFLLKSSNFLNHSAKSLDRLQPNPFIVYPVDLAVFTIVSILTVKSIFKSSNRRYKRATDIPQQIFEKKIKLHGIATSVNDSDNIRFYHTPSKGVLSLLLSKSLKAISSKKVPLKSEFNSANTINVRLSGIDAPEMSHFGSKAQPFSQEAQKWLESYVKGKKVSIEPHRLDQYLRLVATVYVERSRWFPSFLFPPKNVSLEMVKAGYATVYKSSNAEYGGFYAQIQKAESYAQRKKLGMWVQLKEPGSYVSPAEHKRILRQKQ